ncbi:hypothetical protein [Clostridium sp. BNL1100]|uniref:alpha-pore-forming cytotoxin subunit MakB n=1 Tax=Clostridium sp. BNL1100 TaxID=755731 RepID=UPI00024A7AE6|nr:hypothetical protein [Clostridium sp. BNL1100]AEY67470.1 hypothetical protein Clo1100_3325 [Clostridium sp. BNL1100]
MLSPNVNDTLDMLVEVYNDILEISSYGISCNSLVIGHVSEDPEWLIAARDRTLKLRAVMNKFIQKKPDILSNILEPFINYQTLFKAFVDGSKDINTKEQWLEFLALLCDSLSAAIQKTDAANSQFTEAYDDINNYQFLLEESINEGWEELASEEQKIVKFAEALGKLEESVQNLGVNLTASDIRSGQSYIQSMATMAYGIIVGNMTAVPYLSFVSVIFTLGKSFYDVINTSDEIQNQLGEIVNLQNSISETAQAAAITKSVIQVLDNMVKSFLKISKSLPKLSLMWNGELTKVKNAIDAVHSGSDPKLLFDLQTIGISEASWETIVGFVDRIRKPVQTGDAVTINSADQTITK